MSDPLCSCVYQSVFWQARLQSSDLLLVLVEDAESTLHGQVTRDSDLDPLPSEAAAAPSFRILAFGSTQSRPLLTSRLLGDGGQDPPGVLVHRQVYLSCPCVCSPEGCIRNPEPSTRGT